MNLRVNAKFYFILLVFCIIMQNCKNQSCEPSQEEIALITAEIKMRMHKAFEDERSLTPEKMTDIYIDNEDFVFGGDGELIVDRAYLTKSFSEWANSMERWLYVSMKNEYVYVISKDAASYTVDFDWAIKTKKGDTLVCKQVAWTYVLKKVNDEWKSVHCNGTHVMKN